jgi:hypothetical protein
MGTIHGEKDFGIPRLAQKFPGESGVIGNRPWCHFLEGTTVPQKVEAYIEILDLRSAREQSASFRVPFRLTRIMHQAN